MVGWVERSETHRYHLLHKMVGWVERSETHRYLLHKRHPV
jgi:hypothetical protein